LSTGTPFGFHRRMCPLKVIWPGFWPHPQTHNSEMDHRLSCSLNGLNQKAPEARIGRLFYASSLRHTLRRDVLVRLSKPLNRHCKRLRSKAILLYPMLSGMKLRCTNWVCRITSERSSCRFAQVYPTTRYADITVQQKG